MARREPQPCCTCGAALHRAVAQLLRAAPLPDGLVPEGVGPMGAPHYLSRVRNIGYSYKVCQDPGGCTYGRCASICTSLLFVYSVGRILRRFVNQD